VSTFAALAGFGEDLRRWRRMTAGRVASYERVIEEMLELLADLSVRGSLEKAWCERTFETHYHRPLLLFAALRADAMAEGSTHPLWPALVAEPPRAEAVTADTLRAALAPERRALWERLRTHSVQTNETSRAVAWLWPAHLLGASARARPLAVVDVGASAGLNLIADRLPAPWTDGTGQPLPVAHEPDVRLRLGLDRSPLDVKDDGAMKWLEACVWPGEPERLERLRLAVAAMRSATGEPRPPRLEAVDATEIPARIDAQTRGQEAGTLIVAYQTVFIDYVPAAARAHYVGGMEHWLSRTPGAVWIQLEASTLPHPPLPLALRATLRGHTRTVRTVLLGHCDYHPTAIAPDPAGIAALRAAFADA
jgi:hypothetical protein